MRYTRSELTVGLRVLIDNEPFTIVSNEFFKPGKGHAFNRLLLKNIKTGRVLEKTLKSSDTIERADIEECSVQLVWHQPDRSCFVDMITFEQYTVDAAILQHYKPWLVPHQVHRMLLWNQVPMSVIPPDTMVLTILETEPGVKGNTVTAATKLAVLENNIAIRVPLFIKQGARVKVNTQDNSYIERVND
jgi:elongation factor P